MEKNLTYYKKLTFIIIFLILIFGSLNEVVSLDTELTKEQKIYMVQRIIQGIGSKENYYLLQPKNFENLFVIVDITETQIESIILGYKKNVYHGFSLSFFEKLMIFEQCILGMDSEFYVWINPLIIERGLDLLETKIDIINFCQAIKRDYYYGNI